MRKWIIGLFMAVVVSGISSIAQSGEYGVGGYFKACTFSAQEVYGTKGYLLVEADGLAQDVGTAYDLIYHTQANGSEYGTEIIIKYTPSRVALLGYVWGPESNYYDHTAGTSTRTRWPFSLTIASPLGSVDVDFEDYLTTITLGGSQYRAVYYENVSIWVSGEGRWHEFTHIKNFDTAQMEEILHISWSGTVNDNKPSNANGHIWAGAFEVFTKESGLCYSYSYDGGKAGGNYLMAVHKSGNWTPITTSHAAMNVEDVSDVCTNVNPGCGYLFPTGGSGFECFNPNPSPGFWLATVP